MSKKLVRLTFAVMAFAVTLFATPGHRSTAAADPFACPGEAPFNCYCGQEFIACTKDETACYRLCWWSNT